MLNFVVTNQKIVFSGITLDELGDPIVTGSANIYLCHFDFNEAWQGFTKTAVFAPIEDSENCLGVAFDNSAKILDENDNCYIPQEVVKNYGRLRVGIYGFKDEMRMPTVYSSNFLVRQGAIPEGVIPPEEQSLYEQLLERYNQAFTLIEDLAGGTTGQILIKKSDEDFDFEWADSFAETKIDSISVNGAEQPIVDKNVDITVPTKTSELQNDSGFITSVPSEYVTEDELNEALETKADSSDIPTKVSDLQNDSQFTTKSYVDGEIDSIEELIPSDATSSNQLVSEQQMGDAISSVEAKQLYATNTQGSFATKAALLVATTFYGADGEVATPTHNDVAYVLADETRGGKSTKYVIANYPEDSTDVTWGFVIAFSDVTFTQTQMDAINSGATSSDVGLARSAYQKPSSGIPSADMSSSVQESLGKADTALQSVPSEYVTETELNNAIEAAIAVVDNLVGSGVIA